MQDAIKESRKCWEVTTYADGFGNWYADVYSPIGWGNAGVHDLGKHWGAIQARARRAINRELRARSSYGSAVRAGIQLVKADPDHLNVVHRAVFMEKGTYVKA